jgi:hypothetical protein
MYTPSDYAVTLACRMGALCFNYSGSERIVAYSYKARMPRL